MQRCRCQVDGGAGLLALTSPSTAFHAIRAILAERGVKPIGIGVVVASTSAIVSLHRDDLVEDKEEEFRD